jgi:hypothetical protein
LKKVGRGMSLFFLNQKNQFDFEIEFDFVTFKTFQNISKHFKKNQIQNQIFG